MTKYKYIFILVEQLNKWKTERKTTLKTLSKVEAERDRLRAERDQLRWEVQICRGATETEVSRAYREERDRLRRVLKRIATDNDCDPRAEARNALEGKDDE